MKHAPWLGIVACCACLHLVRALVTGKDLFTGSKS